MFDTPPASAITATDSVTVIDPGAVPNHILDINQDFTVQVNFQLFPLSRDTAQDVPPSTPPAAKEPA